ncbi:putative fatty-acid--CoA ligase [Rhodococcus opacus B4]|uniref:Putative fatty-acid--CoA ligase n=1 Tax=Rhodococcus opacus (strain B4) TaxID=632772 RepID=C1BAY8_RHOOB|nr:putative fatty-acid--CoA ligase [Rhodococcus opacus B4]
MVPAMMLFTSKRERFDTADLFSVRIIVVGAAPVPESMLRLYGARGIPVSHCWGPRRRPVRRFWAPIARSTSSGRAAPPAC